MKQQGSSSPLKVNSTTKDLNNSNEEETPNTEFQKIIVRMVNELKEETQKLVSELKRGYEYKTKRMQREFKQAYE
jgi:hypothetical protein